MVSRRSNAWPTKQYQQTRGLALRVFLLSETADRKLPHTARAIKRPGSERLARRGWMSTIDHQEVAIAVTPNNSTAVRVAFGSTVDTFAS
ncbi:MAG: hypothetical protein APF80_10200 [Alphaproteobacteria bacterium BRH_c36]|nr:MAG: hypothetical protein APF80_10200 [Alphaproteobacteria bacterium BRH_c36]